MKTQITIAFTDRKQSCHIISYNFKMPVLRDYRQILHIYPYLEIQKNT